MNIDKQHLHFFNDLTIFIQMYCKAGTIDDTYKWCLESIDTVHLYTVIRVLNNSIIYFRQFSNTDTDLFTDDYHSLMIKVINKFFNTNSSVVNKTNITDISREIMIADKHDPPLQLKKIKIPIKYKINIQNSHVVYKILESFKSRYFQK